MDKKMIIWLVIFKVWCLILMVYVSLLFSKSLPKLKDSVLYAIFLSIHEKELFKISINTKNQTNLQTHANFNASCRGTDINKVVYNISLVPPDSNCFIFITAVDRCNTYIQSGGDFWWVRVLGPASFVVLLIDTEKGIYYRIFNLPLEGSYRISFMLEFNNYDAMKDPPNDWFIKGDYQARWQSEEHFGKQTDRVFLSKLFTFEVKSNTSLKSIYPQPIKVNQAWESHKCCVINEAYGYWANGQYVTSEINYAAETKKILTELSKTFSIKLAQRVLWVFGDSLQWYLFMQLKKTQLCLTMYECKNTHTWIYPLTNDSKNHAFDNQDFSEKQFLNDIKNILLSDEMRNNNSVLLINFGLHVMRTISMNQAKVLMDNFVAMVFTLRKDNIQNGFAKIIWKTTTPVYLNIKYIYGKRFITNQRIIEWNAYCLKKLCQESIPVLDVYWMSASYPDGPWDGVHYVPNVFESAVACLHKVLPN